MGCPPKLEGGVGTLIVGDLPLPGRGVFQIEEPRLAFGIVLIGEGVYLPVGGDEFHLRYFHVVVHTNHHGLLLIEEEQILRNGCGKHGNRRYDRQKHQGDHRRQRNEFSCHLRSLLYTFLLPQSTPLSLFHTRKYSFSVPQKFSPRARTVRVSRP